MISQPLEKDTNETYSLGDFGLEVDDLHFAVKMGLLASSECGENHPPMSKGMYIYLEAAAFLRNRLLPRGWAKCDKANFSRVIHPDGYMSIVIAGGDVNTGNPDAYPCTRSPKGDMARSVIAENNNQMILFSADEMAQLRQPGNSELHSTWYLLYYADTDEVRIELSLPFGQDHRGRISAWRQRIIVPSFIQAEPVEVDHSELPDFDVPVRKRA